MARRDVEQLKFTFAEFFAIWANIQGWKVPPLHLQIIKFLESYKSWETNTAVLQVFRGAAKSTILGLFITYLLVKDPTLRFLILSADKETAVKITNDLRNIIGRHPLALHLRSDDKSWREDRFWVRGSDDGRVPSVWALGVLSNITGSRSDFIIFDDVEVPKNCANEKLRKQLRHRISETVHILVPGGHRLFVGTPHSFESIYPEQIDTGASSLRIPLIRNAQGDFPFMTGESSWPDRFDDDEVADRQLKSLSKGEFLSQYQLIPYNPIESTFDATLLNQYHNEIDFYQANRETVLKIGNRRMVSCSCFWDPSLGKHKSDDSVLALVFTDADGRYFIHRTWKLSGEAEEQCEQIKTLATECHVPQIIIETNGVGGTLPALLRKALAGTGIAVDGRATTKNKAQKIVEAYDVPLSAGLLYVHNSVLQTAFLPQLRDFNPTFVGGRVKDDFIDAVASAILNELIRITAGTTAYKDLIRWQPHQGELEMELEPVQF